MASSNRHWPSMFKTKPWQHDITSSFISNGCQKTPYSSGNEERTPEPKPRWNPRPEQIRILEAIFNSGMVNPPRDEIRKIRAQLQEYGQVGDANVFYWFQNRKSRSKHKQRHIQKPKYSHPNHPNHPPPPPLLSFHPPATAPPPSSSSSSSEKCNPNSMDNVVSLLDAASSHSPTPSINNNQLPYFQNPQNDFLKVPFLLPFQPTFPDATNYVSHLVDDSLENCSSSFLLSDLLLMNNNHGVSSKKCEVEKMKMQQQVVSYSSSSSSTCATTSMSGNQATVSPTTIAALSTINHHTQGGIGESGIMGAEKSTVFINDVAFEVTNGVFNVREAFGDDAMLINSTGQPLLTDEWGVTLLPLHHGSFYYLIRTLSPSTLDTSFTLV